MIMGGCVSVPNKKFKPNKHYFFKSRRFRRKITPSVSVAPIEQYSAAAEDGRYLSVTEFASLDNNKHPPKTCRRSDLYNLPLHDSQLKMDQNRAADMVINEMCQDETWFDSVSTLGSDSDEDFVSAYGEMFPALANSTSSQMIQHDSNFCSMENEHISYGYSGVHHTTDSGKSEKYSIKSEHREANGQSHLSLSSVGIDFPCSKKAEKVFSENEKVQDDFIVSQRFHCMGILLKAVGVLFHLLSSSFAERIFSEIKRSILLLIAVLMYLLELIYFLAQGRYITLLSTLNFLR